MTKILGISGRRGSGKDTLGVWLCEAYCWNQLRFADPIKQMCVDILRVPHHISFGDDVAKRTPIASGRVTVREAQQKIGTEWFRSLDPDCWVHALLWRAAYLPGETLAVVTDVRFPNEVRGIRNAGGKVIRLARRLPADPLIDSHPSETALDGWTEWDGVIDNVDMSIDQTRQAVVGLLRGWGWIPGEGGK